MNRRIPTNQGVGDQIDNANEIQAQVDIIREEVFVLSFLVLLIFIIPFLLLLLLATLYRDLFGQFKKERKLKPVVLVLGIIFLPPILLFSLLLSFYLLSDKTVREKFSSH